MLLLSFMDLYKSNPNANVYIHKFSNIDYILLIKVIFENFEVKPLYRDNNIIKLPFNLKGNNKNTIKTFDSYLILPSSLRTLAEKYEVQKGFFPYDFVNENTLDYVGITPDINYFNNIDFDLYENLINFEWNLKIESLSYLKSDLISLHQVITKFALDIFNNEKVDITKLPTNSSIAFKIFTTNYLNNTKLPIIKGLAHDIMRNAYYGGVVEVFKNEGTDLKFYDINSLYPFSIFNVMPTSNMKFNTDKVLNNYLGFVYVSVDTSNLKSKYINYPLLPYRIESRMYNPLCTWTG